MNEFAEYAMKTRVLVTGSAGFLGSHLCDRLVQQGCDVVGLDNFFTGRKENILHLVGRPNFEMVRHDVRVPYWGEFDLIFHLACPASPPFYQRDAIGTATTCFLGALNMLELAKRTGARIVYSSTSEIYGDPTEHPQSESYRGSVNPVGPRACYDEGKRISETLFLDHHRQHGVEVKVARIFNTYGPRMNPIDGRVISNFIVSALRGAPIELYGDGEQTRSFCFVDDMTDALMGLSAAPTEFTGPINLGNPEEFTVRRLAELVLELTGSRSEIVHAPLPQDDPRQRRPDITLAQAVLGWKPKVPLRDGLVRTVAHLAQELGIAETRSRKRSVHASRKRNGVRAAKTPHLAQAALQS